MARIIWQTEFKEMVDAFEQKHLQNESRGELIYGYNVTNLLAEKHTVIMDKASPRGKNEKSPSYIMRLFSSRMDGDVSIKSYSVIVHGKKKSKINVGLLHHVYLKRRYTSIKGRLSLLVLNKRLKALDYIVCVSKAWEDYCRNLGCKNVKTIYNSFDLHEFVITDDEVRIFLKKKHGIQKDKPIIYIGLGIPEKGILEAYNALKNEGYTLIMTGLPRPDVDIPVKRLLLDRRDYLCLLKASDAVVLMPRIEEGWSRVAHEAMLCRTPVIGSGTGGMKELLEGGKQIICDNFPEIPAAVKKAIKQKVKYGADGYDYVKRFDDSYFRKQWTGFIREVLSTASPAP